MSAVPIGRSAAFWPTPRAHRSPGQQRSTFEALVHEVLATPEVELYHAIEAGVPTYMVDLIAAATGEPAAEVMEFIGVSQTTLRRKVDAKEPLPDVAGHRVMAFLRVAATLRRLLDESGDPEQLREFDMEGWLAQWMRQSLPELGGKSPAEMLRNPEGQRAVEQVLERMRGGLPA
jgi:putative toxin-antitoxin system antitoxin component (TIGR02293 family)